MSTFILLLFTFIRSCLGAAKGDNRSAGSGSCDQRPAGAPKRRRRGKGTQLHFHGERLWLTDTFSSRRRRGLLLLIRLLVVGRRRCPPDNNDPPHSRSRRQRSRRWQILLLRCCCRIACLCNQKGNFFLPYTTNCWPLLHLHVFVPYNWKSRKPQAALVSRPGSELKYLQDYLPPGRQLYMTVGREGDAGPVNRSVPHRINDRGARRHWRTSPIAPATRRGRG